MLDVIWNPQLFFVLTRQKFFLINIKMEIKNYSNDKVLQAIYSKTLKRMEGAEQRFGKERVISNINKNWYWISYKNPKEGDNYYNTERGLVDDKGAYAAIQQAMMDYANYLNIDFSKEQKLSKEDERKLLRKEWMQWVEDAWYQVLSNTISIEQFNNVSCYWRGKVRRIGDLEAWGYNMYGDDLRACMKFVFDRFINKVFKFIENPSPNKTRWTFDDKTGDIYCIDDLYISGEAMEPYINLYLDNNLEIVKKFEKCTAVPDNIIDTNSKDSFDECFLTDEEVYGV